MRSLKLINTNPNTPNHMKHTHSLLLALALGLTAQSARAGLTTDTLGMKGPVVDQGIISDTLGVNGPIIGQGIIADTLGFIDSARVPHLPFDGGDGPDYLVGSDAADSLVGSDAADSLVGSDAADSFDGGDGPDYVYELIEMAIASADGKPVRFQDLFALPGVLDTLRAEGPASDELRGYVDWLVMTGCLVGGPAPSSEIHGYTEVEWTYLLDKPLNPGPKVEKETR